MFTIEGSCATSQEELGAYEARSHVINTALDRTEDRYVSASDSVYSVTRSERATASQVQNRIFVDESHVRQAPLFSEYEKSISGKMREATIKKDLDFIEAKFTTVLGYRHDDLKWSIAGNSAGTDPNILSELTWKDIESFQVQTNAQVTFNKRIRLEGSLSYGWIYDGSNQDSDYFFDDRQGEFSRSSSDTTGDNVFDWSFGAGWQLNFGEETDLLVVDKFSIIFLGGWSHSEQNLRDSNGFQIIPATGPFGGLNSTYKAQWSGPWMGVEFIGRRAKLLGFCRLEYHWVDYDAEADWNLRDDFKHPVSFIHAADGEGTKFSIGAGYEFNKNWLGFLQFDAVTMDTDAGLDRTFFSDDTSSDTQLNNVRWESFAVMLGTILKY